MEDKIYISLNDGTTYKYRGRVSVTTFEADPGKHEPFSHEVEFDNPDLFLAREEAIKWYIDTYNGIQREGKYFLPYASPRDFILGQHAAFHLTLSIVECSDDGFESEFFLLGESEDEMNEGREIDCIATTIFLLEKEN